MHDINLLLPCLNLLTTVANVCSNAGANEGLLRQQRSATAALGSTFLNRMLLKWNQLP